MLYSFEFTLIISILLLIIIIITALFYYYLRREKRYLASNRYLYHLLDSMPDTAVIYGTDLKIVDIVNPQNSVLLGLTREQLIGVHLSTISSLAPSFKAATQIIEKNILHTAHTSESCVFVYQSIVDDHVFYTKARTVSFEKNHVICFIHDVTTETKSQQEIAKLDHFLHSIIDNQTLPLLVKNASDDFRYLYYNESALEFFNESLTEFIGKNDFDLNLPNAVQCREEDEQVLLSDEPLAFERIFYNDQRQPYKWGTITKSKLINNDGSQYIITSVKETTENMIYQERLKAHIFKLDFIIKSYGIILWDWDAAKNEFSSPNPESFIHFGISEEQYYHVIHPEDLPEVKRAMNQVRSGELSASSVNTRLRMSDGSYLWVDILGSAFEHDQAGKVTKITGLRRNITAWKEMTNELITLRDKAEESNRLKSAFLANMSHEIRTPLNAIIGFSDLLTQTENREEKIEFSQIIETNNALLLQLVNDILDLSKIEAGVLDFIFSDVDIVEIFYSLKQMYDYRIQSDVELICEHPYSACVIYTERNRVTQLLTNFLSNAIKFTPKGSIIMGYEKVEKGLRFYVSDTGKGISKEDASRVFERFTKLDSFVQGTGLGLSICETIIQRLNGTIGVDSKEGEGSTFWFTLPCEPIITE